MLHDTYLHAGSMRSEQYSGILLNKESILHIPGRMIGREVECGEKMIVILYFRSARYAKAQLSKYSDHLFFHNREWVTTSHGKCVGGAC